MEKIKLLLYATKSKPYLLNQNIYEFYDSKYITSNLKHHKDCDYILNGKIVAECDFEVEEIFYSDETDIFWTKTLREEELCERSCLKQEDLSEYLNLIDSYSGNSGYAIHIKNLNIFDKPRELNECWANTNAWIFSNEKLYVAPQNMRYCGDWNLKKAILISIRPEYLVRILNKEKTIEIRRKVLKEMITDA